MNNADPQIRLWGYGKRTIVLLHGGPAAPGSLAPVAHALSRDFRVIEAFQCGSNPHEPLTVARHVRDIRDMLERQFPHSRPALLGHSWGAMLALAFAAEYPQMALPLVLVGCGTFDQAAREEFKRRLESRRTADMQRRLEELDNDASLTDAERLSRKGGIMDELYTVCRRKPLPDEPSGDLIGPFDAAAHQQTWDDELRLQAEGRHPAAFAAITAPVLMLHGADDPHPGEIISRGLAQLVPQLEYRELSRCGHSPWNEEYAHEKFYNELRAWLTKHLV